MAGNDMYIRFLPIKLWTIGKVCRLNSSMYDYNPYCDYNLLFVRVRIYDKKRKR